VLDNEYDVLRAELEKLCPESKIFKTATSSKVRASKKKVIHNPTMTSINKCNGTLEEKDIILTKWFTDRMETMPAEKYVNKTTTDYLKQFCMSYKHDGVALSIEYKNGKLERAGLRSKSGKDGTNVTDKMQYIKGVPMQLPLPLTCTIRGELETPVSVFERVSEELGPDAKANPRAHTAGSMGHKTASKIKDRGIQFVAYNVLNLKDPPYKTEIERANWATDILKLHYIDIVPFSYKILALWEKRHRHIDYKVDGTVICINNLEYQDVAGTHGKSDTGNPKGKLAWKFADEVKEVKVKNIVWQTGRIGNITPVLEFNPVQLEGTTVVRCTAHNVGIIRSNKIGIGSVIEIIKSGKIIPKLKSVIKSCGKVITPSGCPSCNSYLEEVKGANDALALVCKNSACPAQNIKNLNHFLARLGVKGIAGSTIEKLIDLGLLQKPGDFYRLTTANLRKAGITDRTAQLIVARVWMINEPEQIKDELTLQVMVMAAPAERIKVPLSLFFSAFGIKNAGREAGRILASHCSSWKEVKSLTEKDLSALDGIGPIMAKEIVAFFENNRIIVEDVEQYFDIEVVQKTGGTMDGKFFVLSGSLEGGKDKWKKMIEDAGGVVKSSVGRKVNYLVAGEGSGSKSEKAFELRIKIITTDQLEKMF